MEINPCEYQAINKQSITILGLDLVLNAIVKEHKIQSSAEGKS